MPTDRRCFLKGIGASAIVATGLSGVVSAERDISKNSGDRDGPSVEELGLESKIESLLKKKELDKIGKVLQKHDIENNYRVQDVRFTTSPSNNEVRARTVPSRRPSIGPNDYFESSKFAGGVYRWSDGKYAAVTAADLGEATLGSNYDLDGAEPRDVAAVAWEGDIFGPTDHTSVHTELKFPDGNTKDMSPKYKNKPNDPTVGSHANAYILTFKDNKWSWNWDDPMKPKSAYGFFQCVLRKQSEYKGRIVPKYLHTWSLLNIADFNFLENIMIAPGSVGVSIDLPTGADSYSLGEPYHR